VSENIAQIWCKDYLDMTNYFGYDFVLFVLEDDCSKLVEVWSCEEELLTQKIDNIIDCNLFIFKV
jgi:hypothetical protein